jgi:hypothetical protein
LEAPDQQPNASLWVWGDASPDAVPGQAPAMTPYASSPAGLYGASPARGGATPGWGDAAFSPTVGGISSVLSPVHGASPIYGASPAYGGVASPVYGGGVASPAYSCVPASRFSTRLSFVPRVGSLTVFLLRRPTSPAYSAALASGINQQPRADSLIVRFCAGPTSPAYSCGPGVQTEPGCFADRSFSTQAYIAGGKLLGAENVLGGVQTCDEGCAMASAARAPNASPSVLGPATTAPSTARYREARPAAWRPRGRGIADGHTNACPPAVGKALTGRERGAGARAHAHLFPRINSIHRHHLPARCGAENLFFRCLHLSSIRVSRSFPHRLADVRISVSTSFIRCYGVARGVPEDCGGRGMRRP